MPEVQSRSGFKTSHLYELIKAGRFPAPIKIGNSSRWLESEIESWIAQQVENSAAAKKAAA
jgi:predicted DNA-binding transcriptional regulator AlpA